MIAADKDLYDLRYFYCDLRDREIGRYSCGMARQTLASIYRRYMVGKIQAREVLDTISKTQNTSIRRFLMEDLCLDAIAHYGLGGIAFAPEETPKRELPREFFQDMPALSLRVAWDWPDGLLGLAPGAWAG